jgi:hypothetical protein
MEISKECKKMLERLKKKAGEAVIYDIDVISLAYGVYGDEHEIYQAMVAGERISGMVGDSIKPGGDKFKSVLKARLLMLCEARENELDNQNGK